MDAALLWLLMAIQVRRCAPLDRAATRRRGSRPAFEHAVHALLAAARLVVHGRLEALRMASAALLASRKPGRVQVRSAWVRAMGEVSLVPVNKKR